MNNQENAQEQHAWSTGTTAMFAKTLALRQRVLYPWHVLRGMAPLTPKVFCDAVHLIGRRQGLPRSGHYLPATISDLIGYTFMPPTIVLAPNARHGSDRAANAFAR